MFWVVESEMYNRELSQDSGEKFASDEDSLRTKPLSFTPDEANSTSYDDTAGESKVQSLIGAVPEESEGGQQPAHSSPTTSGNPTDASAATGNDDDIEASLRLCRELMAQESMEAWHLMQEQALNAAREVEVANANLGLSADEVDSDMLYAMEIARQEQEADNLEYEGEGELDPDELSYEQLMELGERMGDVAQDRWRMDGKAIVSALPTAKLSESDISELKDNDTLCQANVRDGDAAKGTDTAASDESAAIKSASAAGSTDGLRRRAKAGTAVITVTSLEQLRASTTGSRNRVVEWGATWCKPCLEMRPIFEELASQFAGKADFFMADIDEAQDFAKKMGVSMVPTFQVINPEGQVRHVE
eukprot:g2447.t1